MKGDEQRELGGGVALHVLLLRCNLLHFLASDQPHMSPDLQISCQGSRRGGGEVEEGRNVVTQSNPLTSLGTRGPGEMWHISHCCKRRQSNHAARQGRG